MILFLVCTVLCVCECMCMAGYEREREESALIVALQTDAGVRI